MVEVHTDGSCYNHKGHEMSNIGGVGIVIVINDAVVQHSIGSIHNTKSGRMELFAITKALEMIPNIFKPINIYTDSEYCSESIGLKRFQNFIQYGHKANTDLWKRFDIAFSKHGRYQGVNVQWERGHDNNQWNELAHKLANEARHKKMLCYDTLKDGLKDG